jgi:hypothetical protein
VSLVESPTQHGSAIDRVWNALDAGGFKPGRRKGDSFSALCPVHGDSHASLSVKYDRNRQAVLLNCFTCKASYRDIAAAIGLAATDLFDTPLPERPKDGKPAPARKKSTRFTPAHKVPRRITNVDDTRDELDGAKWEKVTTYSYVDARGTVVQEVIREQTVVNGVTHKRFKQRFLNPATGRMVTRKPDGFAPVLYRLPEVLVAIANGDPVWLVEGEKDADNAEAAGLIATTNAQGASSMPLELTTTFRGATVNIVCDRDAAGYKRAVTLHQLLTDVDATVTLYRPAVDDDKADLTDHLEAGLTVDELEQITVDEAALLAAVGEARRTVDKQLQICVDEIAAHMRLKDVDGEDAAEHQEAADAWAAEAVIRYNRVKDTLTTARKAHAGTSPIALTAVVAAETVATDALELARQAHELAGADLPEAIAPEISEPSLVSIGGEPPVFRGDDFIPGDDGSPNVETDFRVRKGKTVQVKYVRDEDGWKPTFHTILHGWAEIQSSSMEDDGTDQTSAPLTEMVVKFYRWARDEQGKLVKDANGDQVIESETVTWDAEMLATGGWANKLGWPGMLEDTSRRGKDLAWAAMHRARRAPSSFNRVYVATGWRDSDTGPYFVHGGGAITAHGQIDVDTRLPSSLQNLSLPEPTQEAQTLREAWEIGTEPLRGKIPGRVIAPLLGLVWEAPFAPVPLITYLHGAPGAGKSACGRQAMHYFAPDLRETSGATKTILSATAAGGTMLGQLRTLSQAAYMPVLADDFVDSQDAKKAEGKLDGLARAVFDRAPRVVAKQRGGTSEMPPLNASVIATGQVGVHGSGLQRVFTIGMNPGDIANAPAVFADLESKKRRTARAVLGAALVQWLAKRRAQLQEEFFDEDEPGPYSNLTLSKMWMDKIRDLPHADGAKGRMTKAAVAATHGVQLMLRMLTELGALTRDQAADFYSWAIEGIYQALRRQDHGAGDPGLITIDLIREALASNMAHLSATDGDAPQHAMSFGWTRRGNPPHDIMQPNGPRIGAIKGDGPDARLYLHPRVTYDLISRVARGAGESLSDTPTSIGSSFVAHGWLTPDGGGREAVGRRIEGVLQRVWDIPLSVLTDGAEGDTDGPSTGENGEPPAPGTPGLFDVDPTPDAPAPDQPAPAEPQTEPALDLPESPPAEEPAAVVPQPAPVHPAARTRSAAQTGGYAAAAAVLHTDGIWMPSGERRPLTRPLNHLGDVAELIAELNLGTKNTWKDEDGQLLVTFEGARALGIPVDGLPEPGTFDFTAELQKRTVGIPFVADAVAAGWRIGGKEACLNATTRVWHPENSRLRGRFVLLPALKSDFAPILDGATAPVDVARRLQRFADALQAPYAISASTTGLDLMMTTAPNKEARLERFAPSDPVPPSEIATLEADIDWHRRPTEEELSHRYVHAYDRGGSYLAGVSGLELGVGPARYLPPGSTISFSKTTPGYWRVVMPEKAEWLAPNPLDPRNRDENIAGRETWVTTPTLDVAIELGYEFEILEAYVWEKHTRLLDTWYGRIRDARTALDTGDPDDTAARNLLKEVYVRSLGLMASFEHHKGREGFAPERYHAIQARSRANIIRRVNKIGADTGRWPVAISRDTIIYTSNEADPDLAWPGEQRNYGRGLGQFKYEASALLSDHLEFLTGVGRYEGKAHLDMDIF